MLSLMNKISLLIATTAVVLGGLVTTLALHYRASNTPASADVQLVSAEYGARIIRNTAQELGSGQADPALRYSGNNLACASCHIDSGQSPGQLSLLESAAKYPALSGRDGGVADLVDRINGCMQRSMNGRRMERDHVAMQSMVAYIEELGRVFHAMGESSRRANDPPAFVEPDRQASVENGEHVYVERCQICHGSNGEGLRNSDDIADGYLFPPLWGPDSYNIGAGMARILTASRFIKARMPLGLPDLTDDETYDVAAYMNAQERPGMDGLELDYPELTSKPVDSPYPPYADPFPVEQHRLGPFGPIRAFYQGQ
jgi:thiosulfate dehydrogenase